MYSYPILMINVINLRVNIFSKAISMDDSLLLKIDDGWLSIEEFLISSFTNHKSQIINHSLSAGGLWFVLIRTFSNNL